MPAPVPHEPSLRDIVASIKRNPRYRARLLREAFIEEAGKYGGCSLYDVGREFWARYGITPKPVTVSQQATLLMNDGRIVRVRHGHYKLAPPPKAPAAPAPSPSIFA